MLDPEAPEQVWTVTLAGEAHVRCDAQVWEEPVVLREIADAASFGTQVNPPCRVEPELAAECDATGLWALQAGDGSQQRGLAGTGAPDERDRLGAEAQRRAKTERSPSEGNVDVEEVHERISSFEVSRMAALRPIIRTPIATAWSRLTSNSE